MIVGNKSSFAIETVITQASENLGLRALGYFVVHIGGRNYGVREPDATMLACAFDEAGRIILDRGKHTAPFASEPNASDIVDALRKAVYAPHPAAEQYFGISIREFIEFVYSSRCEWHRACDEAFDDGSSILLFDVGGRVRLIADKPSKLEYDYRHDPKTLCDTWLPADEYYGVLEQWRTAFASEWKATEKIPES